MDLDLALDVFWIELCHLIALVFSLRLNGVLLRKAEKSPLLYRYLAVQSCLIVWIVSKILKTISPNADMRWFFIVTQYIGVSLLGPCFLLFSHYTVRKKDPPRPLVIALLAGSLICFLIVATNPRHMLFYRHYDFYRDQFGKLFYLTMAYQYLLMFVSLLMLVAKIILNRERAVNERIIGLAALIPLGVNVCYLTDVINPMFDITPMAMTVVLGLFALAAFRFRFLGVLSLADRVIRDGVSDPVLIFDRRGEPLRWRESFASLAGNPAYRNTGMGETVFCGDHYYRLMTRINRRSCLLEYWTDVTVVRQLGQEKVEAVERLREQNRKIRRMNEELLIQARREALRYTQLELHDLLGHSLAQVILVLRSALCRPDGRGEERKEAVEKALAICRSAVEDIDLPGKEKKGESLLSTILFEFAETLSKSGLAVNVAVKGRERPLPEGISRVLLRCCQEGVTNGIKHGGADSFHFILRFSDRELLLLIADNGRGQEAIVPGMGLSGIGERLGSVGGEFRYQGERNGGVMLVLHVPLSRAPRAGAL